MNHTRRLGASTAAVLLLASLGLAGPVPGKKYALLVGVRDYDSARLATLRYTENDVEELYDQLNRPGSPFRGNVRILTTTRGKKNAKDAPTAANIRTELANRLGNRTRHDAVLIALSGHGVQLETADPADKGPNKTFPFFCPADGQLNDVDYRTGNSKTLINIERILEQLGDCGAGAKFLLMDACRNEVKAGRNVDVSKVSVPDGVAVLFSCKSGQRAFETPRLGKGHGVFFYHVLQGLKGAAKNGDGVVTWDSMSEYVRSRVPRTARTIIDENARQTPHALNNVAGEPVVLASAATVVNSIRMELVPIPAGEFSMGAADGEEAEKSERPRHTVRITRGFYLAATEVTQAQYEQVMAKNPSAFSRQGESKDRVKGVDTADFPVESVSWNDARTFCERLSERPAEKKAGRVYRLPTEAEWEYACRAGTTSAFAFGDRLGATKAVFADVLHRPDRVRRHEPNAWGLYGMHGNVKEWCSDRYARDAYTRSPPDDPTGPDKGGLRVLRGGGWADGARYCRSSSRDAAAPREASQQVGFRAVMEQR